MNIAILGFGSQGKSSLDYFLGEGGHSLTVCDRNESIDVPEGVATQLGESYLENLDRFDLLIRAPALHPKDIVEANGTEVLSKVTSNTNLFFEACPTKNIIGVTGTKGKGTTSTLITRMLEAVGHTAHLGGNIGTPPLEMLKAGIGKDDWVVLELANFQLIDLKYSPPIAVCLMVEPEHQDWHTNVDEYVQAKQQLFKWQKDEDTAINFSENALSILVASASRGRHLAYFGDNGARIDNGYVVIDGTHICRVEEIGLPGKHNWQNVCAAVTAVWQVTKERESLSIAIRNLTGLPFRIELRREVNGVKFYNDSFATAPGATIAAIKAIEQPKVMILGGHDRGLPLDNLIKAIQDEPAIRKLLLIGASGARIAEDLDKSRYSNYVLSEAKTMDEIVKTAMELCKPGDAVILSPSFPSFDMFKNFEERGKAFNSAVEKL